MTGLRISETHIAGADVQVGSRIRQRCSWCGAVLVDEDLTRVAVPVGQQGPPVPIWPVGGLVERDGGAMWVVNGEKHEDGSTITPANCCTRLDPDVTA